MPGRIFNSGNYRYGFNGKENANEVKGDGNQQDYGMRIYDGRVGRFLSVDPLTEKYPYYTPYSFAGNTPIQALDLDGLEELIHQYLYKDGSVTKIKTIKNYELKERTVYVSGSTPMAPVTYKVYDKVRNGKTLPAAEVNKEQYQYFDENGNRLNIRRNYEGDLVKGDNEIMDVKTYNAFGSIYIGPTNPVYVNNKGEEMPDYRREPQDEVDAAALQHDKDYDKAKAAGAGDAFFNRKIAFADKKLVASARITEQKGKNGGIDNITNKPVTNETKSRAELVRKLFAFILQAPGLKGENTPNVPDVIQW